MQGRLDAIVEHAVLLRGKLTPPPLPPAVLARRRLFERLDQAFRVPLTAVVAPAGCGKTTLLGGWVRQSVRPAGWLSLDRLDDKPVRFWSYVIAALHTLYPALGLDPDRIQSQQDRTKAGTHYLNTIGADGGEAVLVIDDYQAITDPTIHDEFWFILEHLPSNLHVVIASRREIPLPLHRHSMHGQLLAIGAADLALTEEEIASLGGSPALAERTGGWVAAVRLCMSGSWGGAADYLISEVLAHESAEVRSLVLQTAVLDRLTAPVCNALLGGELDAEWIEAALEHLAKTTPFLEAVDEERRWYRYRPFFADVLRARLRERDPGRYRQLRAAAASETMPEPLSQRELLVLAEAAAGRSNRAIAARLHLAPGTVKWYLEQVYQKLDAHSRTQAVAIARSKRLLA